MVNLKLTIGGNVVDYFDTLEFPLSFQRELLDYKNLNSRSGDYSWSILIPMTTRNRKVFSDLENLDNINKFNKQNNWDFTIEIDDIEIIRGIFKLNEINNEGYLGNLMGNSISWYSKITGTLRELELEEYDFDNHIINDYQTRWDATVEEYDVQYPLICYGNFYNPNWTKWDFADMKTSNKYTFRSMPPAVYVLSILKAIFQKAGLNVAGEIFTNSDWKNYVIPKVGKDESFWNWEKLSKSNWDKVESCTLNGSPDEFSSHPYYENLESYGSVIFDYYILEFRSSPPASAPPVGTKYYINDYTSGFWSGFPFLPGHIVTYNGGDYTQIANWSYQYMSYNQTVYVVNGAPHTWYVNPASYIQLLPFTNTSQLPNGVGTQILGVVVGGATVMGDLNVTYDKGANMNESQLYETLQFNVAGNDIDQFTYVYINNIQFTLTPTDYNFFGGGTIVDVRDSLAQFCVDFSASTLASAYTCTSTSFSVTITAKNAGSGWDLTGWSNKNNINFYTFRAGTSTYKYTVPIDMLLDIDGTVVGTKTSSTTDVGIEGYAFYPLANDINNRCVVAMCRNFGGEGDTAQEVLQGLLAYFKGEGAMPESILAYVDYQSHDNPINQSWTSGQQVTVNEGDNITCVVFQFQVGYLRPMVGWRNISSTVNLTINAQIHSSDNETNVIMNYETGEYVPDYTLINPARCLPNISCQDFVRQMISLYNLYFEFNSETNTIIFYSFDKFFKELDWAYDITNKVEDTIYKIKPLETSKEFKIVYLQDSNDGIITNGETVYTNNSVYSSGVETIELKLYRTYTNSFTSTEFDGRISLPHLSNASDMVAQNLYLQKYNFDFGMRLLKWEGLNTSLNFKLKDFVGPIPQAIWPDELNPENLFINYWNGVFDDLAGKEQVDIEMYLNNLDWLKMDTRTILKWKDNYYKLIKISGYNPAVIDRVKISMIKL